MILTSFKVKPWHKLAQYFKVDNPLSIISKYSSFYWCKGLQHVIMICFLTECIHGSKCCTMYRCNDFHRSTSLYFDLLFFLFWSWFQHTFHIRSNTIFTQQTHHYTCYSGYRNWQWIHLSSLWLLSCCVLLLDGIKACAAASCRYTSLGKWQLLLAMWICNAKISYKGYITRWYLHYVSLVCTNQLV